jgi:hypothetical protein
LSIEKLKNERFFLTSAAYEEDITCLASLPEGEVPKIGNRAFKIGDGNFREVRNGKEINL